MRAETTGRCRLPRAWKGEARDGRGGRKVEEYVQGANSYSSGNRSCGAIKSASPGSPCSLPLPQATCPLARTAAAGTEGVLPTTRATGAEHSIAQTGRYRHTPFRAPADPCRLGGSPSESPPTRSRR